VASGDKGAIYDPDRARALSSTAWELAALAAHWHPQVRAFAVAAATNAPLLPSEYPEEVLRQYDDGSGLFNPPIAAPKRHPLADTVAAPGATAPAAATTNGGAGAAPGKQQNQKLSRKQRRKQATRAGYIRDRPLAGWLVDLAGGEAVPGGRAIVAEATDAPGAGAAAAVAAAVELDAGLEEACDAHVAAREAAMGAKADAAWQRVTVARAEWLRVRAAAAGKGAKTAAGGGGGDAAAAGPPRKKVKTEQ
jgi:hypothetical protein